MNSTQTQLVYTSELVDVPEDFEDIANRCSEALINRELEIRHTPDGQVFVIFESHAIGLLNEDGLLAMEYLGKQLLN